MNMKCRSFIILLFCLIRTTLGDDSYHESLLIKPLSDGRVFAHFDLRTTTENIDVSSDDSAVEYHDFFPMHLRKLLTSNDVQELHFSLTKGLWNYHEWGFPVRDSMPGAEVWLWFKDNHRDPKKGWTDVTNVLSGQFCASLNFIDNAASIQPIYSFRPEAVLQKHRSSLKNSSLFYASLPHETVCTENLTPFKKLLPCFARNGLASLLSASHVFNTDFISIATDVQPACQDVSCSKPVLQLSQTVSIVFNPPALFDGKQSWSLYKLFGRSIQETCPLSSTSMIYVDITRNRSSNPHQLNPDPSSVIEVNSRKLAVFDVKTMLESDLSFKKNGLNIADQYSKDFVHSPSTSPSIEVSRSISGYGLYSGGLVSRITNNREKSVRVVFLDVIPWYLRIYIHTLKITCNGFDIKLAKMLYRPGIDRTAPHHLELVITLPPSSVTQIQVSFDRSFLKWTEFPPDANHGVYAGSAVLTVARDDLLIPVIPSSTSSVNIMRIHSPCLLISLPTPDFSMPYNVICLVSTVVSLAFGPLHNLTTRRTRVAGNPEEAPPKSLFFRIKDFVGQSITRLRRRQQ